MTFIGSDNAIAWAHFRLRGGWRQSLKVAGGFFILASIGAFFMVRGNPTYASRTLWGWAAGMLALNAGILAIYVAVRVSAAVKQDINSKMVESHRMMPMPATHVVAGYIVGNAMQPLILAFGVFLFGGMCAVGAGIDAERWIIANLVLLVFSIFVWVFSVFLGFQKKSVNALALLPILFPALSSGGLVVAPGVLVLLSPIIGESVFKLTATASDFPWIYIVCFVAQTYFAAICFVGAARRYRDPSTVGLTPAMGLAVVLGWIAITWVAMMHWEALHPTIFRTSRMTLPENQATASMIIAVLLALLPISATARFATARVQRRRLDPQIDDKRRWAVDPLIVACAALMPLLVPILSPTLPTLSQQMAIRLALVLLMSAVGFYFLFRVLYLAFENAASAGFVWLFMTWGLPVAIDLLRYAMSSKNDTDPMTTATAASPGGAMLMILSQTPTSMTAGLVIQFGMMLIPLAMYGLVRFSQRFPSPQTAEP